MDVLTAGEDLLQDLLTCHVSEDAHRFAETEQKREGLVIYGRRMYETMVYWETADQDESLAPYFRDFSRVWQAVDKIVVSKSLEKVTSKRTRLVRELSADDLRRLKALAEGTQPAAD